MKTKYDDVAKILAVKAVNECNIPPKYIAAQYNVNIRTIYKWKEIFEDFTKITSIHLVKTTIAPIYVKQVILELIKFEKLQTNMVNNAKQYNYFKDIILNYNEAA